jgi:hypothetical protein
MAHRLPYLQRRNDTLFFRISVPPDLRHIFGGREITKSLKTSDKCLAFPVALSLAAKTKQTFNELRGRMAKKGNKDGSITRDYSLVYEFHESGNVKAISIQAEPHETEAVKEATKAFIDATGVVRPSNLAIPGASPSSRRFGATRGFATTTGCGKFC